MRMVIGRLLTIVRRYTALVDGAFIIIFWVGLKLLIEYLHSIDAIDWEIPRWISLGLIVVIFSIAFVYARRQGCTHLVDAATLTGARLSGHFEPAQFFICVLVAPNFQL